MAEITRRGSTELSVSNNQLVRTGISPENKQEVDGSSLAPLKKNFSRVLELGLSLQQIRDSLNYYKPHYSEKKFVCRDVIRVNTDEKSAIALLFDVPVFIGRSGSGSDDLIWRDASVAIAINDAKSNPEIEIYASGIDDANLIGFLNKVHTNLASRFKAEKLLRGKDDTDSSFARKLRYFIEENSEVRVRLISDTALNELYARIKPVVRASKVPIKSLIEIINNSGDVGKANEHLRPEQLLFWISDVDPRNDSFIHSPNPIGIATDLNQIHIRDEFCSPFKTYHHNYGDGMGFRPKVSEIFAQLISQIPQQYWRDVVAFETEYWGGTSYNSYYIADTRIYTRNKKLIESR